MRSELATDEPPYFWTSTGRSSFCADDSAADVFIGEGHSEVVGCQNPILGGHAVLLEFGHADLAEADAPPRRECCHCGPRSADECAQARSHRIERLDRRAHRREKWVPPALMDLVPDA